MAAFYRPHYGDETDELFHAMEKEQPKIALINPDLSIEERRELTFPLLPHPTLGPLFYFLPKECAPRLIRGLLSHYFLDISSVEGGRLLPLGAHKRVLDMCSAPGGKLLVMMSQKLKGVHFLANDMSFARAQRLKRVLAQFLPQEYLATKVKFTVKDANYFGIHQREQFDAILLDAPCSSEAHVLHNPSLRNRFKGPSKNLPIRQYALLSSALHALKPGGFVLYATCSINKFENEGVIKKALHKKNAICELIPLSASLGDTNEVGITILPHRHQAGPAFFSLLRRRD